MTLQTPSKTNIKTPDIHSQNGSRNTETALNAPPC